MCLHTQDMVVLMCGNDCILIAKDASVIDEFITSLTDGPEKVVFTNEGTMSTFLNVEKSPLSS